MQSHVGGLKLEKLCCIHWRGKKYLTFRILYIDTTLNPLDMILMSLFCELCKINAIKEKSKLTFLIIKKVEMHFLHSVACVASGTAKEKSKQVMKK